MKERPGHPHDKTFMDRERERERERRKVRELSMGLENRDNAAGSNIKNDRRVHA
jgi:hypothetical protein